MAQPITCDLCQAEESVLMQTSLTDGGVLAIGPACLPQFFGGALLGVIGSDGHAGPPTKCQACRRSHERMTTPVAPMTATQTAADDERQGYDEETGAAVNP